MKYGWTPGMAVLPPERKPPLVQGQSDLLDRIRDLQRTASPMSRQGKMDFYKALNTDPRSELFFKPRVQGHFEQLQATKQFEAMCLLHLDIPLYFPEVYRLVHDEHLHFLGLMMRKVGGKTLAAAILDGDFTDSRMRHRVSVQLSDLATKLRDHGLEHGDPNPWNLRLEKNGKLWAVDPLDNYTSVFDEPLTRTSHSMDYEELTDLSMLVTTAGIRPVEVMLIREAAEEALLDLGDACNHRDRSNDIGAGILENLLRSREQLRPMQVFTIQDPGFSRFFYEKLIEMAVVEHCASAGKPYNLDLTAIARPTLEWLERSASFSSEIRRRAEMETQLRTLLAKRHFEDKSASSASL